MYACLVKWLFFIASQGQGDPHGTIIIMFIWRDKLWRVSVFIRYGLI